MDWTGCNLVERDPEKLSGVPIVKGTRMQADGILANFEDGLSVEEISYEFDIEPSVVQSILFFAEAHKVHLAS